MEGPRGLQKGGLQEEIDAVAAAHPDRDLQLWCQDEARFGQKGRVTRRWWEVGEAPPGLCDRRFLWTYLYGAVRPESGESFALVLPIASTEAMQIFLDRFSRSLEDGVQAVMLMDRAGWHTTGRVNVPDNVSLVFLPSYSPELNPIERVWLHLRDRFLSHRLLDTLDDVVEAVSRAWNRLADDPERLHSLTSFPYLQKVRLNAG